MKYKAKAWIEDGIIRCASQMCDKCVNLKYGKCFDVVIEVKEEDKND